MRSILFFVLVLIFFSCKNSKEQNKTIDNIKIIESHENKLISHVTLDSFILKSGNYSAEGFSVMKKDSLYLVDQIFSTINSYNLNGEFNRQYLGKKSAYNLQSLYSLSMPSEGGFLICDGFKYLRFSKDWKFVDSAVIRYPKTIDNNVLLEYPKAEYPDLYEIKYTNNSYPNKGKYLLVEIESEHPKFNGFSTKNYYQTARNLALLDPKTRRVNPMFGSWSKPYKLGKNYPYFANINYQYESMNFYINFEIDSLIYVFDTRFTPQYAFGRKGKIINDTYLPSTSIATAFNDSLRLNEREVRGFYGHLFVESSRDLIFRSYFTGKKENKLNQHRLQIYKVTTLIGDLEIPYTFKIIGYKLPYFYAEGDNLVEGKKIYKFKINTK